MSRDFLSGFVNYETIKILINGTRKVAEEK